MILSIFKRILSKLISIIPTRDYIAFCSYPDYTDNAYAVYFYMVNNNYGKKFNFVWLVVEKNNFTQIRDIIKKFHPSTKVILKISFLGFYYYVISRYIFYTHGCWDSIKTRQHKDKMINMFHGMPLKRFGYMDNKPIGYMANTQFTVATSAFFKKVMAESFAIPLEHVLLVGQPRNDLFFIQTDFFCDNKVNFDEYESIGIWLPTYRASTIGDIRIDGTFQEGKISFLGENELDKLNEHLYISNKLLLIKLHPMDILQNYSFKEEYSNILIIKQNALKSQLYPLLGACDYLLTDYSSVWVDFDICDKPIGFVMNDFEEYNNTRGFTMDNVVEMLPGQIMDNLEILMNFIDNPSSYKRETYNKYNLYKDGNSTERLLNELKLTL